MSKRFFWLIGISAIILIGVSIYFGLQALEPRTYLPQIVKNTLPVTLTSSTTTPTLSAPAPAPTPPPTSTPLPKTAQKTTLSLATNKEAEIYFATSTPREINPNTLKLNLLDVRATVYANDSIIITERPSAVITSSLWKFNPKTKTLTPIAEKERGLMATWSKNSRFALLFSLVAQSTPYLRFIDTKLGTVLPIHFTTLPTKCAVTDEQIMYCGAPKELPPRVILPDDYLKKKLYTDDTIIMIDVLGTRITTIPYESTTALDIYNPVRIGDALFFVNRLDEKVYKVEL